MCVVLFYVRGFFFFGVCISLHSLVNVDGTCVGKCPCKVLPGNLFGAHMLVVVVTGLHAYVCVCVCGCLS